MKKLFVFLGIFLLICGCGRSNDKSVINDFKSKLKSTNAYHLVGTLEIFRNEEKYTYNVESSYSKGDLYKVSLINQNNNHEQIILRNDQGIYVITPSLNKSFKFQSDWPYNNSQIYLLQPIISDLENDEQVIIERNGEDYIVTSRVNYSSEKDFKKQKVYFNSEKDIKKIEVLDDADNVRMTLTITDIDYKAKFDNDYFDANRYYTPEKEENNTKEGETSSAKIDDIIYPMYVPADTYLLGQDIIQTGAGERAILTFAGESSFTIVQETLDKNSNTNYVYGDPYLILDTVGAITDYSVSWISNGVEYSIVSDTMSIDELLTVAQSISVKAVSK